MNEYQWYNNSFPALPAASETGTRNSKRLPVWLIALITSFLTSAVLITIFAAFVLPFLRTPTTIHYSGSDESPVQLPQADLAGFSIAQVSQKAAPSTVYISSTGIAGGFFNQPISQPSSISESTVSRLSLLSSAFAAHSSMPWDSTPRILRGARFASNTTFLPTISSGV